MNLALNERGLPLDEIPCEMGYFLETVLPLHIAVLEAQPDDGANARLALGGWMGDHPGERSDAMLEEPQDEMRQFIVEYLRQLATTGMPVEETVEDPTFWRIEPREEGAWALIQERPDGGGSEEKGQAADRETALTIAGIFNALSSDPEGMSPDLAERAYADMATGGPAQKELWARILRGLMRNPLALEMYMEGAGHDLPPEARDILRQRLVEAQVN